MSNKNYKNIIIKSKILYHYDKDQINILKIKKDLIFTKSMIIIKYLIIM